MVRNTRKGGGQLQNIADRQNKVTPPSHQMRHQLRCHQYLTQTATATDLQ